LIYSNNNKKKKVEQQQQLVRKCESEKRNGTLGART